jgi:hypothetical protein
MGALGQAERMDLDLEIGPGRPAITIEHHLVRELEESDLHLAAQPGRGSLPTAHLSLANIKERHHTIARLLAAGESHVTISAITGMSPSRISILANDPAMLELVAHYRATEVAPIYRDLHERLSSISLDAASILQERMEEEPEKMTSGLLVKIVEMSADRTGHGPMSRNLNVNVNIGVAERLKEARKRAAGPTLVASPSNSEAGGGLSYQGPNSEAGRLNRIGEGQRDAPGEAA